MPPFPLVTALAHMNNTAAMLPLPFVIFDRFLYKFFFYFFRWYMGTKSSMKCNYRYAIGLQYMCVIPYTRDEYVSPLLSDCAACCA
jgi:hypothetical protein